jgi:MFS family permease
LNCFQAFHLIYQGGNVIKSAANHEFIYTQSGKRLPSNYIWVVVGMLWFITFFNYADRMALTANLPLIRTEMHLDKTTGGMLGSAFGYSYGICAIFAGFIVDRVRRRNAVLLGLCLWSAICIATSFSTSFWMLFAFLALEGLGEAFYFPAAMSLVSDYHGKRTRSRAMSINQTSVYFGTIGGTYFAGRLGMAWGWRSAFLVFGALGVVLAFILWRFLHEPRRGAADLADSDIKKEPETRPKAVSPQADRGPFVNVTAILGFVSLSVSLLLLIRSLLFLGAGGAILDTVRAYAPSLILAVLGFVLLVLRLLRKDREFGHFFKVFFATPSAVLLLFAFLCANSVATIILVWMPTFVVERFYGNDIAMLAAAGLMATMPLQLASMFGSPTGGALADFLRSKTPRGRILVQVLGVLCAAPFVFLCGQTSTKVLLITALAGWGMFKGIYDSNIFASVYDVIPPHLRGMAAGFMNMFGWAGGALAPIIAGHIADNKAFGLGYAISGASGIYILASFLLFCAAMFFVKRDVAKLQTSLCAGVKA